MKFKAVTPLSRFGRISRSLILVALLIGSLFPTVGGIGLATIASPLALLVVVYELGRWIPKLHPVILVPIFFSLVALHAQFFPPMIEYGANKYSTWFTATLLTAVAASMIRDERSLITFCHTWLIATGLLAVITVAGFGGGRAEGFDSNPIWLARAMATGIVMALFLVMQHRIRAWVFLGISALLIVGIFATGSRGPILAVGVGAIVLVLFTRHHRVRRIAGITLGAGAAYWAVTRLPFFQSSRIVTLLQDGDTDLSRNIFWSVTPPMIAQHPDGVGIGNWSLLAGAPRQFMYPHNIFLEVFAEFGIWFGVGLIVLVVTILIRLLLRSKETPTAILVFGLLAAEIAQVSVSGDLNARTFWFLLVLAFLVGVRALLPGKAGEPDARPLPNAETPRLRPGGAQTGR